MARPPADFQPDTTDTTEIVIPSATPPSGAPALPANPPTPDPLLRTTLAPSQQLQPDTIRQFYRKGVPQIRISPLPVQASTATGASAASQSKAQSGSIAQQAAEAQLAAQAANTGVTAIQTAPANVTGLSVSEAVIKDSTGVLLQYLFVTFVPPAANYYAVDIFAVGYQGSTQPVLVGSSQASPANFSLHITGETITLYVVAYSDFGVYASNSITSAPSVTAILNGVTTAPPAPVIASALAATSSGVSFSWNIENDPTHDVIKGYRVYKNTVNNSTTATAVATIPQPAITTGTHVFNDILGAGQVAYYWVSAFNTSALESALTPAQSTAVQSGAIAYRGAYSGTTTYNPGDDVTYSGQFYTCILQSTGNLPTNTTYWQATGATSADVFLGAWSSTTAYVPGNQVTYSGGYYICTASSTNNPPSSSPSFWQVVGSVNTYIYTGAYSAGTSYVVGNQVTYNGSYWICISATTANAPSTTSSFWTLVGTSALLLGAYVGSVQYVPGNEVTYLGNIYKCILATLGNPPTNTTYWTLIGTNSLFLGSYSNTTAYVAGNQVTYNGNYYICILATTGNLPTNATYWQLISMNSSVFLGAYNGATAYVPGNQVTYNGGYYICIAATTGNVPTNPTYWQVVSAPNASEFIGAYSGTTAYLPGNQVTYLGSYYICIASTTGNAPTNVTYWQLISTTNTYIYLGAYNGATAYVVGNEVSYQGSFWICISTTTGNAPSTSSSFWTLLGTSVILIGAWSSVTAYVQGNEVTYNGNVFQALQANTNQVPPTPPGTSAYWQLMGPASLDSVGDGTGRFAATASSLTYRPLTNPLTGHDAGTNATVNVAAFTMRTSNKGDISCNSGSITALSYGTLYYIYYDDGTLAGGAVTYQATTTKVTAIQGAGRFFLGSIMTPVAGGPDTVGNNDGGVGAQYGSTAVFLFGATANTGTNAVVGGVLTGIATVNTPQNAIDGSLATFAELAINNKSTVAAEATLTLSAASPTSAPWSSLTLYVLSAVPVNTVNPGGSTASVSYFPNGSVGAGGGVTIFAVSNGATRPLTMDAIALPVNTNLALINILADVFRNNGTNQTVKLDIYGAWIVGLM